MDSRLFSGKEEKPILLIPKDERWLTHVTYHAKTNVQRCEATLFAANNSKSVSYTSLTGTRVTERSNFRVTLCLSLG